jgi:hypothetical protein
MRAVTIRRGSRPAQVRPRPTSTGRLSAPDRPRRRTGRIAPRSPIGRDAALPIPIRFAFAVTVATLGIVVLAAATGVFGRAIAGIGGTLAAAVDKLTATPAAAATEAPAPDAPVLAAPGEAYTRARTVDISGTIPGSFVGQADVRIRLYVAHGDDAPAVVDDQPAGATVAFTFAAVNLREGANTFTATIVRGDAESDSSAAVRYVRDTKPPALALSSPEDGDTVNAKTVTVAGRTQPRSRVLVHNTDAGSSAATTAGGDGSFAVDVRLDAGANALTVTSTDPAGNSKSVTVAVRRGNGHLTASISASRYTFSRKSLPEPVTVRVTVLDPDGRPLEGADVTFTISVPGVPALTSETKTDSSGGASFSTTIPKGAMVGTGPATVLVHAPDDGQTTDRTVITIVR